MGRGLVAQERTIMQTMLAVGLLVSCTIAAWGDPPPLVEATVAPERRLVLSSPVGRAAIRDDGTTATLTVTTFDHSNAWSVREQRPPEPREFPQLVVAVWDDGTIVRSMNGVRGGRPYVRFETELGDRLSRWEEESRGIGTAGEITSVRYSDGSDTELLFVGGQTTFHARTMHLLHEQYMLTHGKRIWKSKFGNHADLAADEDAMAAATRAGNPEEIAFRKFWQPVESLLALDPGTPPEAVRELRTLGVRLEEVFLDPARRAAIGARNREEARMEELYRRMKMDSP